MRHLGKKSPTLTVLAVVFVFLASSSFAQPDSTPDDTEREEATERLQEYFEFPRRKLTNADLERLHLPSAVIDATADQPAVIFTGMNAMTGRGVCDSYPVILTSSGEDWWIAETGCSAWEWNGVWTSADSTKIWAALTFYCGDPGGEVMLLHSADGGWTWRTLSVVNLGYYMYYYQGFRLTPDGDATVIASWYRGAGIFPCPIHPNADPEGPHSDCSGLLYFKSADGGHTWDTPKLVHGSYTSIQARDDGAFQPFMEYEYLDIEELAQRFPPAPKALDTNRLHGAETLPFDQAVLARAMSISTYNNPFLEVSSEEAPETASPFILDYGSQGVHDGQLIKLPFSGYRWVAMSEGSGVGILQSSSDDSAPTWIVQQVNPEREWTAGKLPSLPRAPYCFDSLVELETGALDLHVIRLPSAEHPNDTGREVYRSIDEGRTWEHARSEPNVLVPVPNPEYRRAIDREKAETYLPRAMESAVADVFARPAPPIAEPGVEKLALLFKTLDWRMPKLAPSGWDYPDNEHGQPALHFAATYTGDSVALLKALIEAGADTKVRALDGLTALDVAVRENATEAAAFLREQPTDWGGAGERGRTSLHWLADTAFDPDFTWDWKGTSEERAQRALDHARFFLEHGADPNVVDDRGRTPLDIAREKERSPEMAELLVEYGARVSTR